ncbi:AAA family ATPase [uncultured Massilia sp.]|uniref:AAA family ATPase n=1 Tax=uncultured Massilia sp. TaxID=169973 RepID=UPI0025D99984|nr:AAA family ATPase [uncultured Massilia sp.]
MHFHSPAPLPTHAAAPAPRFGDAQARALADALCAAAGHVADAELTRYLVRLFASLPHAPGDLVQVLSQRGDEIAEAVEKDARDSDLHTLPDQFAALLSVVETRAGDPAAQPWLDVSAFIEAKKRTGTGAGERTDADKDHARFLNKVMGAGMMRRSQPAAAPLQLMGLRERFPNFERPIRFLAEQGAYARLRGMPFQPVPILLAGPAGCGKTSFAAALAELLGSRSEVLNMASQTCGFSLGGMDRGWSSARPGLVFEALLHGTTLSPVILLDEIDKTASEARSDPLGPLYTLLEPRSARTFRDEYAGFPVDASQVVWLATANDTAAIPAPLLSRFKVFEIAPPSGADLLAIAESMLAELGAGLPQAPRRLPPAWHARLAACSVRDLRIGLQEALGRAALRAVSDGAALTLDDQDLVVAAPGARAPMGFR